MTKELIKVTFIHTFQHCARVGIVSLTTCETLHVLPWLLLLLLLLCRQQTRPPN